MKKFLFLLPILAVIISCQKESSKLTDIEKISFDHLSPENFYNTYHILNSKKVNVDSLRAYNRDTLIGGSYELHPFDAHPKEIQCYPDYSYYSQTEETQDHITEEDIKEKRVFGVTPVTEIAEFKNIKFNYASFITDKRNHKIVGAVFSTRNHAETDYYKKNIALLREKLGNPKVTYSGFTDDNGGPVHYPLVYDIWFLNGKMFQFHMNLKEEGADKYESITLVILNENLTATFDSSFNMNFTVFKDYLDEERSRRFRIESLLMERVDPKDLDAASERAKTVVELLKKRK
ncbi:hypothetical protein DBR43_31075 [Pedobacter sp. KBW06]|uniref:hypothetical protein n=1 Tax=Pedobacter sp. KBW06 TaxID=2153359 RepID=UPI000F5AB923|nr:hypothetical protein [Pedobacter sp. KBW06]RQO65289.1 hypothetical protein DBR43_31075 [Pedobacter sp. KBW06]